MCNIHCIYIQEYNLYEYEEIHCVNLKRYIVNIKEDSLYKYRRYIELIQFTILYFSTMYKYIVLIQCILYNLCLKY